MKLKLVVLCLVLFSLFAVSSVGAVDVQGCNCTVSGGFGCDRSLSGASVVVFDEFKNLEEISELVDGYGDVEVPCVSGGFGCDRSLSGVSVVDSFAVLDGLINGSDGVIRLDHDYFMYGSERGEYVKGIVISKTVTIDGNGHTINANKIGRMFNIAKGGSLTLINVNLVNGRAGFRGGVIENYGVCNIIRSCFVNSSVDRGGVVVWNNGTGFSMIHSSIINTSVVFGGNPVSVDGVVVWNNGTGFSMIHSSIINTSVVFPDSSVSVKGVVVWNNGTGFSMIHSSIINSSVVFRDDSPVNLTLIDSSFVNGNVTYSVVESNGGFYTVISSRFVNNSAYKGLVVWNNCTNFSMIHSGVINTSVIANVTENDTIPNLFPDEFFDEFHNLTNSFNEVIKDLNDGALSYLKESYHFVMGHLYLKEAYLAFKLLQVKLGILFLGMAVCHIVKEKKGYGEVSPHLDKLCHDLYELCYHVKRVVEIYVVSSVQREDKLQEIYGSYGIYSPLPPDAL